MNTETSRRSACDRCRGQKLRCVRRSKPSNDIRFSDEPLEPCDRCLKAGAECINTHLPPRKLSRTDQISSFSSQVANACSSDRPPSRSNFPTRATSYQRGVGLETEQSRHNEGLDSTSIYQPTMTQFTGSFAPQLSRPRSKGMTTTATRVGLSEQMQAQGTKLQQNTLGGSRSQNAIYNSMRLDPSMKSPPVTNGSFATEQQPRFSLEASELSLGLSPQINAQFDDSFEDANDLFASSHGSSFQPHLPPLTLTGPTNTSRLPDKNMGDMKQEQLHQLSQLSSNLLKDFSNACSATAAEILSSTLCCRADVGRAGKGSSDLPPTESIIGRVLHNSQLFVDLLTDLIPNSPSPGGSECSYSDSWDDNEFVSVSSDQSHPYLMSLGTSNLPQSSVATFVNSQSIPPPASPIAPTIVDMPTTFTILTCYACLLQTYDIIFSRIRTCLSGQNRTASGATPALFLGLSVGGISLDSHPDMQMEVFIQLASKMLDQIETRLGISVALQPNMPPGGTIGDTRTRGGQGILDPALASTLLDVMLRQQNITNPSKESNDPRPGLVRQDMENIRSILKQRPC